MTMILTDRADLASEGAIHPAIRSVAVAFGRWRAARARRAALQCLLSFDAHRLDDLGLSVETVREALAERR